MGATGGPGLEVALALAVLHGRLGDAVVGARLPALGDTGGGYLGHHLLERDGRGADRAGTGHVPDGAVADRFLERLLAVDQLDELVVGVEHSVAAEHLARMRE